MDPGRDAMSNAESWAARLSADPSDATAYAALKAHYLAIDDIDAAAQLMAAYASASRDDTAAAAAYVELGALVAQNAEDSSEADPYYLEALRRDPLATDALDGLNQLWSARGEHGKLTE